MVKDVATVQRKVASLRDYREGIEYLQDLWEGFIENHTHEAMKLIEPLVQAAVEADDSEYYARALHYRGDCYLHFAQYDKAQSDFESALDLFACTGLVIRESQAKLSIAVVFFMQGSHYTRVWQLLQESIQTFEEFGKDNLLARAYGAAANFFHLVEDDSRALEYYHKSLKLRRKVGDTTLEARCLFNIGILLLRENKADESLHYLRQSLEISRAHDNTIQEAMCLQNIAQAHYKLYKSCSAENTIEEILQDLQYALEIFDKNGTLKHSIVVVMEVGWIYVDRKEYEKAIANFVKAIDLASLSETLQVQEAIAIQAIGVVYRHQGKTKSAIKKLEEALELGSKINPLMARYKVLNDLALAYSQAGEYQKAYECQAVYTESREQFYGLEQQKAIAANQAKLELEQVRHQQEVFRLKSEQLERDILVKSNEVKTVALHLAQKNELLQQLKERIRSYWLSNDQNVKTIMRTLQREIDNAMATDSEWDAFERHFRYVHDQFIHALSSKYPSLTPTELKVCSLMKINLSTKDMASLLCASLRTVQTYRYRIRKKLKLAADVNLGSYLAAL